MIVGKTMKVLVPGFAVLTAAIVWGTTAAVAGGKDVTMYKPAKCDCCSKWAEHMKQNGFHVTTKVLGEAEMDKFKAEHGVTEDLASCHTAIVGGYVIEGHVPAADVQRLLKERPRVVGLTAPGMPMSAPGMDEPGEAYDVFTFDVKGNTKIYSKY